MKVPDVNENMLITSYSSTKRQILLLLKKEGEIDLTDLSGKLGITKMGILNHIKELEEIGLVERFKKRGGVGRPRTAFKLTPTSSDIFPKAYSAITSPILEFIEDNMGRNAVFDALKKRQGEVFDSYNDQIHNLSFKDKIEQLAKFRDNEGYMVELTMSSPKPTYELLEFNCPILNVADKYPEACEVERELFSELLDAEVTTTHRTVSGDHLCRFVIKPKKKR